MENIKLLVDYGTLGILGIMSLLVVMYAIERALFSKTSISLVIKPKMKLNVMLQKI